MIRSVCHITTVMRHGAAVNELVSYNTNPGWHKVLRHMRITLLAFRLCVGTLLLLVVSGVAHAASIVVAFAGNLTSLDPHFHNTAANNNIAEHMFEPLIARDTGSGTMPGLALSWTMRDGGYWEIKLRPNVRFHDGGAFTSADVVYSLERIKAIKNSPSPYTMYTRSIKRVVAVDKLTVHIYTDGPALTLPLELAAVCMVSKAVAERSTTEDFNTGKALVGTGPFKFSAVRRNERIDLVRNDSYWGKKAPWDAATILLLQNEAARSAALLSEKVDLIESVPTQDLARIASNPAFVVTQVPSFRLMYLHLDSARPQTPFAFGVDGKPLAGNPLADVRVRRAMSLAINRQALTAKVLEGMGVPSGQLVGASSFGHLAQLPVPQQDVAEARKLLAQAGYPHGFRMTIHSPNDHYVNDRQVVQTVATMLSKVGIQTEVQLMPPSVFFTRANKREFSLLLAGWNADSGMTESIMIALLASHDVESGMGNSNRGRYSSAAFDKALAGARGSATDAQRKQFVQEATRIAINDVGIIPLYFQTNVWASKKGLKVSPRQDGRTYIHHIERVSGH